jgi:hypothetical protein
VTAGLRDRGSLKFLDISKFRETRESNAGREISRGPRDEHEDASCYYMIAVWTIVVDAFSRVPTAYAIGGDPGVPVRPVPAGATAPARREPQESHRHALRKNIARPACNCRTFNARATIFPRRDSSTRNNLGPLLGQVEPEVHQDVLDFADVAQACRGRRRPRSLR